MYKNVHRKAVILCISEINVNGILNKMYIIAPNVKCPWYNKKNYHLNH